MDTLQAIAKRKSTRDFSERQISAEDLQTLLEVACAAPVAHGEYDALHLTVVQDPDLLADLREAGVKSFHDPILDIVYGAPTVVIVSTKHGSVPELDMANAGVICESMLLAATSLGIDSCYVWGTVVAIRAEPGLLDDLQIPDGYDPLASVALGYSKNPSDREKPMTLDKITINRV